MASERVTAMRIEDTFFFRKRIVPDRLEPFGFVRDGDHWRYEEDFLDGDFRAEITVDKGGVSGRVIDLQAGEEYLPVHYEERIGAFVGTVRLAYTDILTKIADACCEDELFIFPQTNRIASEILAKYGEKPDHPFSTAPTYGVFRCAKNRKWYGLVMDIPKKLVTGEKDANDIVEVINIKIGEEAYSDVTARPGIYDAYHMKKKNWASVILDGTVPDDYLMELIDKSREFALSSGGKGKNVGAWIVPANPAYYDIDGAFAENEEIFWKQGRGIKEGDTAFVYLAAPASEVRYRCLVTETDIPYVYTDENVSMKSVMKIKLLERYPEGRYSMARLRELGIKFIRGPVPATEAFIEAVKRDKG